MKPVLRFAFVSLVSLATAVMGCSGGATTAPSTPPPAASGPMTTGIGPIDIQPGEEKTVCSVVVLSNPTPVMVTRMAADLAPGSHHIIVYRTQPAQPTDVPFACRPFVGVAGGQSAPIFIVEKPHDDLVMPNGVGLRFEANQTIKLEAHYINPGSVALQGKASVTFTTTPEDQAGNLVQSDIAFWGTKKFSIPPQSAFDTGPQFQPGIAGTTGFAATTHQHHFGTRFRIWSSTAAGDTAAPAIADTSNWAEPPLYRFDPALTFGGTNGLSYQCEWQNTSSATVGFGESALDEMCFLWMYYYPSHGFDACIDQHCLGR